VQLAIADMDNARDIASPIEQRVHPYLRLAGAKRRPRKQRERHLDCVRVQRVSRVAQSDAEGFVRVQLAGNADQSLAKVGAEATVPCRDRTREGIARDLAATQHMVQFLVGRAQISVDIPQALANRRLRKCHAKVLVHGG